MFDILAALDGSKHSKTRHYRSSDLAQRYGSRLPLITVTMNPSPQVSGKLKRYMEVEQLKIAKSILMEAEKYAHSPRSLAS